MFRSRTSPIIISISALAALVLAYSALENCWYSVQCTDTKLSLGAFVPFVLLLLIFSTVFYFVKQSLFEFWVRFTVIAVPLSIIIILLSPIERGGFIQLYPDAKTIAAIGVPVLYTCIFLLLAGVRALVNRKKRA